MMEQFSCKMNPGLALLTDWIVTSGNTALSVDLLMSCLEQLNRDDIVDVVQKGQESEVEPAEIFISYQWDNQDEVTVLREVLEKNGFTCWMDIGQMGGGDHLYNCIYDGIKNAKVVIACLTPRYVVSHHCNKEIALADLLHKPIIPVVYEQIPWPPAGAMSLIFAQLVYVNLRCVGGHGGSGIHADLDDKYREIVTRASNYTPLRPPRPVVAVSVSPRQKHVPAVPITADPVPPPPPPPPPPSQVDRSGRTPDDRADPGGGVGENPSSGAGGASARGPSAGSGHVQPVSVTKCTVCTIL